MFIEPDEHLIIMDMNHGGGVDLTYDEMCLLRTAGVRTLYYQAAIRWDVMQPKDGAPLDWSVVDSFVENARRAGLKMLIPFVYSIPRWKPDEFFYSREQAGELCYGVPNYGSADVTAELDAFMVEVIERYGGEDAQVIYSIPGNGEFALHLWPRSPKMDYPMNEFVAWVVARQRILVEQHDEIWTGYHPYTSPEYWEPVYGALFSEFPFARHYGFIFTYVQHSRPHIKELIHYNQRYGMTYYAGTEYVQGMAGHVPRLIDGGVRMLTAPKHPFQQYRGIEPWMLETIEKAIAQYEEAQHGTGLLQSDSPIRA